MVVEIEQTHLLLWLGYTGTQGRRTRIPCPSRCDHSSVCLSRVICDHGPALTCRLFAILT